MMTCLETEDCRVTERVGAAFVYEPLKQKRQTANSAICLFFLIGSPDMTPFGKLSKLTWIFLISSSLVIWKAFLTPAHPPVPTLPSSPWTIALPAPLFDELP
jgi:hypothetical protein